jgi:tetratricopeptide (TPR) repeat protein
MDYHHPDDRKNIFSDLQKIGHYASNKVSRNKEAFDLLIKTWDKVSGPLWYLGYWEDYYRCAAIVLESSSKLNENQFYAQISNEMGWFEMEQEKFNLAKKRFKKALAIYSSSHDVIGQCRTIRYLGTLYHRQKKLGSALNLYKKAIEVTESRSEPSTRIKVYSQRAEIHNLLGNLYSKLQNFDDGYDHLICSLSINDNLCSQLGETYLYYRAAPLLNLGRLYFYKGNYGKAELYYRECIALCESIHRPDMKAGALIRLAELSEVKGNYAESTHLASMAESLTKKESPAVRNKARRLQDKIKEGKKSSFLSYLSRQFKIYLSLLDLLIYAPLTGSNYILNILFPNPKFGLPPLYLEQKDM